MLEPRSKRARLSAKQRVPLSVGLYLDAVVLRIGQEAASQEGKGGDVIR